MTSPRRWGSACELALGGLLAAIATLLASTWLQARPADAGVLPESPAARPIPTAPVPAAAGEPAEPVASYELSARLDAETHEVSGRGTIVWVNTSQRATDRLMFHLYMNAFKNTQSLFYRSPFVRARSGYPPERWGTITIESLRAREMGGGDLMHFFEPYSPNDPLDTTEKRLSLPQPVHPGGKLTLEIEWKTVLPSVVDRTGFSRDFHLVAQWFPKLARLESDGTWASFPFHPHGEFYADFGNYDITLDVPDNMVVGATGQRVDERALDSGRRSLRYKAQSVIDFAWTAWPGFQEHTATIDGVEVRLLHPPGHDNNVEHTLSALRFALPHFNARYGVYPHKNLTVVHPPQHAPQAGGMEYPGLITTGGPWHSAYWSRAIEAVTVHELAHQWFYGLLASNEQRWPFLDEGLTSYAEHIATDLQFGAESGGQLLGLTLSARSVRRASMQAVPDDLPLALPASGFPGFRDIGGLVYARTALLMETLGNVFGADRMENALIRYTREQRFRHPGPEDLLRALAAELGPAAAANARASLFEGRTVDFEITDLRAAKIEPPRGIVSHASSDVPPRGSYESRVVVRRHGELRFPVDIRLVTQKGETIRKHWDGHGRFEVITHAGDSPVVHAEVDPDRNVIIDDNLLNNARATVAGSGARTTERALYALQLLIGALEP